VRFTGQVRVPEVDHPGIPATIVVEDGLAEVLLEGESLGRWSLYDVHAARLVSSAFSISLDGEEITFIADEPVDFAYKGVEHMAGVWARYKAMTIPRRVVAVGRSRRGTTPSRIPELREAMLSNLRTAPPLPTTQMSDATEAPFDPDPSPWAARLDAYSNVPAPIEDVVESEVEEQEVAVPEAVVPEADVPEAEQLEAALADADVAEPASEAEDTPVEPETLVAPPRMRPGPGLIPRQVTRIAPVPSSLSSEPLDWETAWEEPPSHEEAYEEPPADADRVYLEQDPGPDTTSTLGDEALETIADPVEASSDETVDNPAPEGKDGPQEVVLDLGRLEVDQRGIEPVLQPVSEPLADPVPEPVAEPVSEPVAEPAAVAVADHAYPGDELLEPDLELLFAGAPGPEGERSGLFGAVRSAFTRNRAAVHVHEFVEAPGGIGIVRQICAECGYISIGVSD
jgi:hypothetical protein